MTAIYKYRLDENIQLKHKIIKFLDLQDQNGHPTIWAIVDDEKPEKRNFQIYAVYTGWSLNPKDIYLGTWQDKEDGLVYHFFLKETPKIKLQPQEEELFQPLLSTAIVH